jgi:hypothetical protein
MGRSYFKDYCRNLQRIGMVEMIDEQRRQIEMRSWRASLIGTFPPAAMLPPISQHEPSLAFGPH